MEIHLAQEDVVTFAKITRRHGNKKEIVEMALWQWDIWLVPRRTVFEQLSVVPSHMDLDWFESVDWWAGASEGDLISFSNSVLPVQDTPWAAKDTRRWGTDDGDEIMLVGDKGLLKNISIRIDLRSLNADFLSALTNFAKRNDFLFYSLESRKFIEPDLSELFGEIKKSRKVGFLQDPISFFQDKKYLEKIDKENRQKPKNPE
jgi:hypothetical protein